MSSLNTFRKIILLPFSLVYVLIIIIRNYFYDNKMIHATKFTFPIICVGNLSTGGTGKTPHTNYLINLLKKEYDLAVLSRGYNRKTSGYIELQTSSLAIEVGDEPLFYKWKHPDVKVSVCEDRVSGISQMAMNEDKEFVYLLDDAFQHRAIKAGLNIILTEYNKRYTQDFILPSGNLREPKSSAKRADIIVVSKCPPLLSEEEKRKIRLEINSEKYQFVVFSSIKYQQIYPTLFNDPIIDKEQVDVLLVSGIANPKPLENYLKSMFQNIYTRKYSDHYNYKKEDIESIIRTFKNLDSTNKVLITTEKDATRLFAFKELFIAENINIYCIPIEVKFDGKEKMIFDKAIKHYLSITLPKLEEKINENIINYDEQN
jgi:tetraacyldisaccharide 4'-kinase